MSRRILFATGNEGKMREIRMLLADLDVEVLSMKEAGIQTDIEENGTSFEENALIKARAVAACAKEGDIVLADDSGLEVDYPVSYTHLPFRRGWTHPPFPGYRRWCRRSATADRH